MQTANRPTGMFGFTIVWLGQIVSVLATQMTLFALTIWVFEETGSATALGLMQVFFITPFLLISPLAGVMVDRHNRKLMMMVSDLGAGIVTVIVLILQYFGVLEIWHLYAAAVIQGLSTAFQWPAYSAAISTMVPKEQYGRANGMMSLVEAGPGVVAPLLAGALLPLVGLFGILFIDVGTFIFAIAALLFVHVPQPARTEVGEQGRGSFLKEAWMGFRYIFERPGLLGLQMMFLVGNLFSGIIFTLLAPMVLSQTGNNSLVLGSVQTSGAIASVIGGVIMSLWGGFKKRAYGVLIGWLWTGVSMALIGLSGGLPYWIAGMALSSLVIPFLNGSNQAIWQAKVAPDIQGRVFSARRLIAWITNPLSPLIAGTLADYVFEPAMKGTGSLPDLFGSVVGTGPGTGMALLILISAAFCILWSIAGFFNPHIRNVETVLPDHDELPKAQVVAVS
jgi:DHA3 family macrolide efflux protein-like MFS transporter